MSAEIIYVYKPGDETPSPQPCRASQLAYATGLGYRVWEGPLPTASPEPPKTIAPEPRRRAQR